jgi:hypothetical protein
MENNNLKITKLIYINNNIYFSYYLQFILQNEIEM